MAQNEVESPAEDESPQQTGRKGLPTKTVVERNSGATGKQNDWHYPNLLRLGIHATTTSGVTKALLRSAALAPVTAVLVTRSPIPRVGASDKHHSEKSKGWLGERVWRRGGRVHARVISVPTRNA